MIERLQRHLTVSDSVTVQTSVKSITCTRVVSCQENYDGTVPNYSKAHWCCVCTCSGKGGCVISNKRPLSV